MILSSRLEFPLCPLPKPACPLAVFATLLPEALLYSSLPFQEYFHFLPGGKLQQSPTCGTLYRTSHLKKGGGDSYGDYCWYMCVNFHLGGQRAFNQKVHCGQVPSLRASNLFRTDLSWSFRNFFNKI